MASLEGKIKQEKFGKKKSLEMITADDSIKKLGIKKPTDWYQINFKDIKKIRGRNLQRYYKTILDLAKYNDPSFKYLPWKFKVIQRNYFNNKKRIAKFINWIKKQI